MCANIANLHAFVFAVCNFPNSDISWSATIQMAMEHILFPNNFPEVPPCRPLRPFPTQFVSQSDQRGEYRFWQVFFLLFCFALDILPSLK
jgi:hypothetical protein